jgi:hypothetical protein
MTFEVGACLAALAMVSAKAWHLATQLGEMRARKDIWEARSLNWEDQHGTSQFLLGMALQRLERHEGRTSVLAWYREQEARDAQRKAEGYI